MSIKLVEIKTSLPFNLGFASDIILPCFLFFFLIINFYFLIPAIIAQILNPAAELVISIRTPTKEAKTQAEIHPVTAEAKMGKCLI